MSKGAVGLVAGYWPEDIYRYLAVPGLYLDDGLVGRPARRRPQHPALILEGGVVTYQELASRVERTSRALLAALQGKGHRVALAASQPLEWVSLFFGAAKAQCMVLLLDPSAPPAEVATQIRRFRPDILVAEEGLLEQLGPVEPEVPRVSTQELRSRETGATGPRGRLDLRAPAIALPAKGGRLFYHSHSSLIGGAVSWSTFVPLKEEDVVLNWQPLYTWEGLYNLLPILFRGGSCVLTSPEGAADAIREHRPGYTILPLEEALGLFSFRNPLTSAMGENLKGVFVSVQGPFLAGQRRRLKSLLLDKPVLTLYGSPEAGVVLASHPTWYLDEAVGIPVTNVDVWPLNPATGAPLQVPWEAVEYGEIGVKSPMVALHREPGGRREEDWLRTGLVATMDPNGLFYLRSIVPEVVEGRDEETGI